MSVISHWNPGSTQNQVICKPACSYFFFYVTNRDVMKRQRLSLRTRKPLLTHVNLRTPACACDMLVYELIITPQQHVVAVTAPASLFSLSPAAQDVARNPFGMFDNMMANVRNRMEDMHRNFVSLPPLPSSAPLVWIVLRALSVRSCVLCFRRACPPIPTRTRSTPRRS